MTTSDDLKKLVEDLGSEIESILKSKSKWYEKLESIIKIVLPEVENIGALWKGSEKKELAMQLVEEFWFKYLNIKYVPDFLERIIVRKVSSSMIDKAVKFFNEKGIFKHKPTA